MNKLELQTRNLEQIRNTLIKCNGITIIIVSNTLHQSKYIFGRIALFFRAKEIENSNQNRITLLNGSKLFILPKVENYLRGFRAHQVILYDNSFTEKEIQEIALPLIATYPDNDDVFLKGVFRYRE